MPMMFCRIADSHLAPESTAARILIITPLDDIASVHPGGHFVHMVRTGWGWEQQRRGLGRLWLEDRYKLGQETRCNLHVFRLQA